jgi:hypothetical protein
VRRSDKKPQFLVRDNGESFYMVGHVIGWPVDLDQSRKLDLKGQDDKGTFTYDRWLEKMAENSENWGRVYLTPWTFGLEAPADWTGYEGMRRYSLGNAWRVDHVLDRAAQKGIALTFTIQHKTEFEGSWKYHAYMTRNGGPCRSQRDFFSNPEAVQAFQKRLRYIVARWGYSPNVLAWELWGEVNLVPGVAMNDGLVADWHRNMAIYLKEMDPWRHMVFTHCHNWQVGNELWALPWIDCVQGNGYIRPPNLTADHVDNFRRYIGEVEQYGKPIFVAEFGARGAVEVDYFEAQMHSGLWASIFHPFAGVAISWWWNAIDGKDLYWHYKGISAFVKDVDRVKNDFVTVSPPVTPESCGLRAAGMRADDMVVAWVYHGSIFTNWAAIPDVKDASVTLEGLKGCTWRVEYWDTCAAEVIREETVKTDSRGMMRLVLPPVRRDIALKLRRSEADAD